MATRLETETGLSIRGEDKGRTFRIFEMPGHIDRSGRGLRGVQDSERQLSAQAKQWVAQQKTHPNS